MLRFKKVLSVAVSVALFLTAISSVHAAESTKTSEPITKSSSRTMYTSDGELIGTSTKTLTTTFEQVESGVELTIVEERVYNLTQKFAEIPEYKTKFANYIEHKTVLVTKTNEIYENGKLMNSGVSEAKKVNDFSILSSGGIARICHYYDANDNFNYHFASYSDMDMVVDQFGMTAHGSPTGNNLQKDVTIYNSYFNLAKSSVDSFEDNYDDFQFQYSALVLGIGFAIIGTSGLAAVIGAGGPFAVAAYAVLDAWNDARDDLHDAYNYISYM